MSILKTVKGNIQILAAFLIIAFVMYYPFLKSGPLWDDWVNIFNSWTLQNVNPIEFWKWGDHRRSWPVFYTVLSWMLKFWGNETFYYHSTSIFLHAVNSFLVFHLIKKMKGNYALLLSLIYLMHPVHFFTVGWIIQLKTIMSITFFLGSVNFFLIWHEQCKEVFYFLALLFFSLSLLAKSSFAPLVLLAPLYKERKRMLPFILICFYSISLTLWTSHIYPKIKELNLASLVFSSAVAQELPDEVAKKENVSLDVRGVLNRVNISANNLFRYSLFLVYPKDNLLVHPSTQINFGFYNYFLVAVFVVVISFFINYEWRKRKDLLFLIGISSFLLTLVPLTGLTAIPIFHFSNFVEYWLSVPLLGIVFCLSRVPVRFYMTIGLCFFCLFFFLKTTYSARAASEPVDLIMKSIKENPQNDLVRLILAKHYFFTKEYLKSNEILLKVKKNGQLDRLKIDQDIEINLKGMNGEKINEYTL